MSGLGQTQPSGIPKFTSAAGGRADVTGPKADVGLMSVNLSTLSGGCSDFDRLASRFRHLLADFLG